MSFQTLKQVVNAINKSDDHNHVAALCSYELARRYEDIIDKDELSSNLIIFRDNNAKFNFNKSLSIAISLAKNEKNYSDGSFYI